MKDILAYLLHVRAFLRIVKDLPLEPTYDEVMEVKQCGDLLDATEVLIVQEGDDGIAQ